MSPDTIPPQTSRPPLIAIAVSFERDNLLARGLGLDHLKELLVRLTRPLLRQGISLAYGGNWDEQEGNFTYELLRLVSAEKTVETEHQMVDGSPGNAAQPHLEPRPSAGRLINHSAWPDYFKITPAIEAQWINCCRIVRTTPVMAGIPEEMVIPPAQLDLPLDDKNYPVQAFLHQALCLSAMRQAMLRGVSFPIPDHEPPESIPPIDARIVLGGKIVGYRGFMPGIFEEVLLSLEARSPLYLLGGFGGATEVLAEALLAEPSAALPEALQEEWHRQNTPGLALLKGPDGLPAASARLRETSALLRALREAIQAARSQLAIALNNGLDDEDNRRLLTTRDMREALGLVHKGLARLGLMTTHEN